MILIDALNMFIRSYVINPTLDTKGRPIGGVIGFMKSLQKVCRELRPHEVIVCWDGLGGSQKRKAQNKNYKAGRKPLRFNRRMIELPEDKVKKNRADQQLRLHEYLNNMPVIQLMIDFVEADDIIALVSKNKKYEGWQKIIVSALCAVRNFGNIAEVMEVTAKKSLPVAFMFVTRAPSRNIYIR